MCIYFQHASEGVERMILGNKCDMEDKRMVAKEKGEGVRFFQLLGLLVDVAYVSGT